MKRFFCLLLCTAWIVLLTGVPLTAQEDPQVVVRPGQTVVVGEEVMFDGSAFLVLGNGDGRYEWDFGDGEKFSIGYPVGSRGGTSVVHYYKNPGNYTVTFTTKDSNLVLLATRTLTMTVTGNAVMAGFELWHAPFHARIDQFCKLQIPSGSSAARATVKVVQEGSGTVVMTLLDKNNPAPEEVFLFPMAQLNAGNYMMIAELKNSVGSVLAGGSISEKISKPYIGQPKVGIDKNNNIVVGGKAVFPVQSWFLTKQTLVEWGNRMLDSGFMASLGGINPHPPAEMQLFLDMLVQNGLMHIGEDRWIGKYGSTAVPPFDEYLLENSNVGLLPDYIHSLKDSPAMLAWCWDDEPNMGIGHFPPHMLGAWSYLSHLCDPQRPVIFQSYRYIFLPIYLQNQYNWEYCYRYSDKFYEAKKSVPADILHGPIFAVTNYKSQLLDDYINGNPVSDIHDPLHRGAIDLYLQALDLSREMNADLIPIMTFSETCDISETLPSSRYTPTPEDLRMYNWLSVIHGCKGLAWYPYQQPTSPENKGYMAEFYRQVKDLTPVILAAPDSAVTVTDNANSKGQRVDTMIRETATDVWLFAARVTELDYHDDPALEAETIAVQFSLSGLNAQMTTAYLYQDGLQEWGNYGTVGAGSTFNFTLGHTPIQPGTVIISGFAADDQSWMELFDDGNGKIFRYQYWTQGGIFDCGTVNYATGQVNIQFRNFYSGTPEVIEAGVQNVRAMYAPIRTQKTLPMVNGVLQDQFERMAVRIYRIPKQTAPQYDDLIATWETMGLWQRISANQTWKQLSKINARQIVAADFDDDGQEDVLGWWDIGCYVRLSSTAAWQKLGNSDNLIWIAAGDINADGKADFIGSYSHGLWWRDTESTLWQRLSKDSPIMIACHDFNGNGISNDIVGVWPYGVWVRYGNNTWEKMAVQLNGLKYITAGDINGQGEGDIVGSWDGDQVNGVWVRYSEDGSWERIHKSTAQLLAAGDINGNGPDDLIGVWESIPGIWVFYSQNNQWEKLHSQSPGWIGAARMTQP